MTAANWYWFDGECYCPDCVECETPAIDAADATRGPVATRSCCHCCGEAVQSEYRIAYAAGSGEWDVVDTFTATDDDAANAFAEATYAGDEWYVLDANGRNINGGRDQA